MHIISQWHFCYNLPLLEFPMYVFVSKGIKWNLLFTMFSHMRLAPYLRRKQQQKIWFVWPNPSPRQQLKQWLLGTPVDRKMSLSARTWDAKLSLICWPPVGYVVLTPWEMTKCSIGYYNEDVILCTFWSDSLCSLQGTASTAETTEVRQKTIQAGKNCAVVYKDLLEQVSTVRVT
jgi:hypothetical protein